MAARTLKSDFRVVVRLRAWGDLGIAYVSGDPRSNEEKIGACENIAEQIRRHVDDLPSGRGRGVTVEWDSERVCEHCAATWTEEGDYNGGCCEADERSAPASDSANKDGECHFGEAQ